MGTFEMTHRQLPGERKGSSVILIQYHATFKIGPPSPPLKREKPNTKVLTKAQLRIGDDDACNRNEDNCIHDFYPTIENR